VRFLRDDVRKRILAVAIAALAVLALSWTWMCEFVPFGWDAAAAEPAAHDGETLVLSLFNVEAIEGADRYRLRKSSSRVEVIGETASLHVGEDLSLGGTFRASDGVLVESWRVPAPLRDQKKGLGILALILTFCLVPVWFRVRDGWIVERG
jgi:hypothetical protein